MIKAIGADSRVKLDGSGTSERKGIKRGGEKEGGGGGGWFFGGGGGGGAQKMRGRN